MLRINQKNMAIIGGGAVGPLLLSCIAQESQKENLNLSGFTFHLIDKQGFGNGGIAYGQCHQNHLLNSVAGEMSPHDEGSFSKFLEHSGVGIDEQAFYPRHLYKSYIDEELKTKSIDTLVSLGARVEEHQAHAFVHQNIDGSYAILNEQKNVISNSLLRLPAEQFVITVGYGPNNNFSGLKNYNGFVDNLYDSENRSLVNRYAKLKDKDLRIAVIGSGPGLYDLVNEIEPNDHKLLVFSNAGKELGVRDTSIESQEVSIPPEGLLSLDYGSTFEEAIDSLTQEFTSATQGRSQRRVALDINKNLRAILMRLGTDVAYAFKNSSAFRPVQH